MLTVKAPSSAEVTTSRRRARAWPWSLALLGALVAVWELVTRAGAISPRVLPSFSDTAAAFVDLLTMPFFYENVASTLKVIFFGLAIAIAAGAFAAVLLAVSGFLRRAFYPLVVTLDVIPKVTLVPLFVIVFGFGETSKVVVVASTTFFPVFIATLSGLRAVDESGRRLMRSMGASRWQIFAMYEFKHALPAIFAGIRISTSVAFIAAVISEFLIRNAGLGHLITSFRNSLQVDYMLASTVGVALIGSALYFGTGWLERRVVFWVEPDPDHQPTA